MCVKLVNYEDYTEMHVQQNINISIPDHLFSQLSLNQLHEVELFCGLFHDFVDYFCSYILDCTVELHDELERSWTEWSYPFGGYSVFRGGSEGGGCGWKCTTKNPNHEGSFRVARAHQRHKSRLSHLQEHVQQVLENVMVYPLAKQYPMFCGTHRLMIVFTRTCLFSTNWSRRTKSTSSCFNPLNAELIPICRLLALLGAHHILHVSRIRVKMHLNVTCRLTLILPKGIFL